MTNFTYQDLDSFAQHLNQAKDLLADIAENVSGCYPDNGRTPDLRAARRQSDTLLLEIDSLRNEVRKLWAIAVTCLMSAEAEAQAAEATCNCSNPFCQV
jgi:hypothetical protein